MKIFTTQWEFRLPIHSKLAVHELMKINLTEDILFDYSEANEQFINKSILESYQNYSRTVIEHEKMIQDLNETVTDFNEQQSNPEDEMEDAVEDLETKFNALIIGLGVLAFIVIILILSLMKVLCTK